MALPVLLSVCVLNVKRLEEFGCDDYEVHSKGLIHDKDGASSSAAPSHFRIILQSTHRNCFMGLKRPENEAEHSLLSGAEANT
jgi:hypothetical protein